MVEKRIYNFSENGTIHGYKWYDENLNQYKGVVILVHGMAEHIERYEEFAQLLIKNGYIVYGNNQRGHKDTSTKENYGYMSDNDNLQILVNDIYELQKMIEAEYPDLPINIFGHSMGSFVTQRYIELYGQSLNSAVLCGSALQPKALISMGYFISNLVCKIKGRHYRSKLLDNLSFGSYNKMFKPNRTDFDWLNRDEKEVDKYINDEYCGGIFTASYFKDFMKHLKTTVKDFNLVPKQLPIFIISGSDDPVGGKSKYVKALYEKFLSLNIASVQMKLYEGARHEILLELCKEEVMNDVLKFFNNL